MNANTGHAAGPQRAKRIIDVVLAGSVLLVSSPVLAATAIAVKLDSPGPALFRQERVGLGGSTFRIHKFRTMRQLHNGSLVSATGDARITRVGRILRKSKLDELPQLLDVLIGHMSLVGPRPEVPMYVEMWSPEHRDVILSVRPGITDPATVELRNEADELAAAPNPELHYTQVLMPRKTAAYVRYVNERSIPTDFAILAQTLRAIVTR